MAMRRYITACIAQWRRSKALLEATGCRIRQLLWSDNIKGTYLPQFLLMVYMVNTLKMGAKQKMAPTNNRGMNYQTKEKDLNNLTEYFVGGINTAFNCIED